MRKLFTLFAMCALCVVASFAESVTITVSPSTGQCLRGGSSAVSGAGSYYSTWKSTNTTPQLTLSTSKNDMWIHTDGSSVHYFGGVTFTMTVPTGYAITGYSFDFVGYEGNSNSYTTRREMTVTDEDGNKYECTATTSGRVEVTDIETMSTKFNVVGPVSGNGNVLVTNFKVVVDKNTYPTLQPFETTTITTGQFAKDTPWYTFEVKAFGRQAYRVGDSSVGIQSNNPLKEDDAYLWCFVGSRETGFKIYNKAAGATKCYAVNKGSLATGAAPEFVVESSMDEGVYDNLWYFTASTSDPSMKGYKPVYLSPSSNSSYALNDYQGNGVLKFWDGRDAGSTFTICPQGREIPYDGARTVRVFDNAASSVPYRIPALAKTADGKLVLVVDYRYSKADIGNGPIDLRYKISADNGRTWSEEYTNLGDGDVSKSSGNQWDYAFGDPSIVADREDPNEILVMAVGGHVGYFSSTYSNPQHVVRFRSHDGGTTWTKGDSLTYQIYNLYKGSVAGDPVGIFLTSGKIMQSRYIKAGSHYRLYIAHPFRGSSRQADFVIYADDFGETWKVLGGKGVMASSGCDESKIEELPDGSVVISSRVQSGGRVMNVFTYTNSQTAEGTWSTDATPDVMASGKVNACNGGILVVPAKRNSDGKQVYVALQSVPMSSSRQYVGFYYKELADAADFITGKAMAANWQAGLRVSETTSCYSTMVMMDNDSIAFVYEENGNNGGYDIVFKALSLDTITANKYSFDKTFTDRSSYFRSSLDERIDSEITGGNIVGMPTSSEELDDLRTGFEANPTQEGMEQIWAMYQGGLPTVPLLTGRPYRLRNAKQYTAGVTRYMSIDNSTMTTTNSTEMLIDELFVFQPTTIEGQYYMYSPQRQSYVGRTGANETKIPYVASTSLAGRFVVDSKVSGISTLACNNPTGTNIALHCASDGRLVPWTTSSEASGWYIEPVDEWELALTDCDNFSATAVCLPFKFEVPEGIEAYGVSEINELGEANISAFPSAPIKESTPIMLISRNGKEKVALSINTPANAGELGSTNILQGALAATTADNPCLFGFKNGRAGFYPTTSGLLVPANTAYLVNISNEGAPLNYAMLNVGIVNGQWSTDNGQQSMFNGTYDLQGRRVMKATKGIFIENGKKVIK